jgi:hypothetical protein
MDVQKLGKIQVDYLIKDWRAPSKWRNVTRHQQTLPIQRILLYTFKSFWAFISLVFGFGNLQLDYSCAILWSWDGIDHLIAWRETWNILKVFDRRASVHVFKESKCCETSEPWWSSKCSNNPDAVFVCWFLCFTSSCIPMFRRVSSPVTTFL